MAYNNAIPQATDQLSQSQQDILNNFIALQTLIDVNHITFDVADQGKHKFVTFPVPASQPVTLPPTINAGEMALYNNLFATTGTNQLFVTLSDGTSQVPFTAANPTANLGWSFLPSGILMKWGFATITGLTNIDITFGPAFTSNPIGFLTPFASAGINTNTFAYVSGVTATQLSAFGVSRTIVGTPAATTVSFLAIGPGV